MTKREKELRRSENRGARVAVREVEAELGQSILGQEAFVRGLLVALVADGHVLIEGVPGLGKTRAVDLLARSCKVWFKRVQFTPDLLPADILGTRIYNQQSGAFETARGPVFTNFLLADEINRAPAKVQSALLETMQERQVTLGRESLPLPSPFLVFATQNPIDQEGTYPLPEAQLDRFLFKLVVSYPEREKERAIVKMVIDEAEVPNPAQHLSRAQIEQLQAAAREVFIEDRLISYATDLVAATRDPEALGLELGPYVELGASPRGSIALARAARALALIEGRDEVLPDDIKSVARDVLRHRILLTYLAAAEGVGADSILDQILAAVKVP